jgi:xanthine/CO dehydrogenase XdhC/CoxF family maturation factor
MPVTYTNCKGITYTLCQGVTKTGKPRYTFVRDPQGKRVVEAIPEGWEISESVNGVVSLVKERPQKLLSEEIEAVKAAVRRHPKARNYRVNVKPDRIEVYEAVGPDAEDLIEALRGRGFDVLGLDERIRAERERYTQFTPVLRFILQDEETRVYRAERWCYLGSIDDWIFITTGPVEQLARRMIPTLGTDEFFELF